MQYYCVCAHTSMFATNAIFTHFHSVTLSALTQAPIEEQTKSVGMLALPRKFHNKASTLIMPIAVYALGCCMYL